MNRFIRNLIVPAVAVSMSCSFLNCFRNSDQLINANAITSNPVISRNVPAYSENAQANAKFANDDYYYSFWSSSTPDYIAYDLSGVPAEQRETIDAVWYNPSSFDIIGNYVSRNLEPSDYTIEVNAAKGGEYPTDGWKVVETVTGNTLSSRQHIIDFKGFNWIRMKITGADGKSGGTVNVNFDVHNVSQGVDDSWIFYGDSITAGGMNNCYGTGFATYVNELDSRFFPIQENGGIGGITSTDGKNNIDRWLSAYKGHYVSIAYGTNDAWGNQSGPEKYYTNTVYMIDAVIKAGKIPVIPKIPYSVNKDVNSYLDNYNAMVDKIYSEYPQVIKGPDFNAYFKEHPEMLSSDGVHPNSDGYAEMRKLWADTMYQNVYKNSSDSEISGDVNNDGKFDISDVVATQKWIICNDTPVNLKAADIDKNSNVDIFDVIAMRKLLLSK